MVVDAEYLSLPPTRHDLTQGQKPERRLKWEMVVDAALLNTQHYKVRIKGKVE